MRSKVLGWAFTGDRAKDSYLTYHLKVAVGSLMGYAALLIAVGLIALVFIGILLGYRAIFVTISLRATQPMRIATHQ